VPTVCVLIGSRTVLTPIAAMSSYTALALACTVALLSDWLSPEMTSGPVLKLSPSTAQFMPLNWLVAALAGDAPVTATTGISVIAARAPTSFMVLNGLSLLCRFTSA
jgi:hypothetical protein